MSGKVAVEPKTVKGGPTVVVAAAAVPPEPRQKKMERQKVKPKPKLEPEQMNAKQNLLTAKDFVEKFRREVRTASWDPAVLRKCGRGAEQILMTLGAHQHKEKVPMREQARRKKLHEEQADLEGIRKKDTIPIKKKTKKNKK